MTPRKRLLRVLFYVSFAAAVYAHANFNHCQSISTPLKNSTNTSFYDLPSHFAPAAAPQDPFVIDQIRHTLALYPLCIDGKNFDDLRLVFAEDAVANYSEPLNVIQGLKSIEAVLETSLKPVTTQHQLGTQIVELIDPCMVRTLTYFRAVHFGKGVYEGQSVTAYGQYRDVLVRRNHQEWRIAQRTLAYMGQLMGNLSIFSE